MKWNKMVNHKQYYRVHFNNPIKWKDDVDCIFHPLKFRQFKTYLKESSQKGWLICRLKKNDLPKDDIKSYEFYNQYWESWIDLTVGKLGKCYYIDCEM